MSFFNLRLLITTLVSSGFPIFWLLKTWGSLFNYSRNVFCTPNCIPTFLFNWTIHVCNILAFNYHSETHCILGVRVSVTFKNISAISWWSVLLVEKTGVVPGESAFYFRIILLLFHSNTFKEIHCSWMTRIASEYKEIWL